MSALVLKLIALGAMITDHAGEFAGYLFEGADAELIIGIMRVIGRMAFPVYAFLVAEGCSKTKNMKKYLLRLLLFAVISEIPFKLMLLKPTLQSIRLPLFFSAQNVLFTLLLGAAAVYARQVIKEYRNKHFKKEDRAVDFLSELLCMIVLLMCAYTAAVLYTDYDMFGVGLIYVLTLTKQKKYQAFFITCFAVMLYGGYSLFYSIAAAIPAVLVYFYNGKRGKYSFKYFFYVSYPAHILLLYGIYIVVYSAMWGTV